MIIEQLDVIPPHREHDPIAASPIWPGFTQIRPRKSSSSASVTASASDRHCELSIIPFTQQASLSNRWFVRRAGKSIGIGGGYWSRRAQEVVRISWLVGCAKE